MASPLNISLLDIDSFVRTHNCGKVTSTFIYESSSKEFAKDGLFSEAIFGQIGSTDRLIKFGYIDLRTTVFHPIVYSNLVSLKSFYSDLLARKVYAIFDKTQGDFVRANEEDEGANTGFKFFMDHYKEIKFVTNESISHNDKIQQVTNAGNLAFISKCIVMPAQIRDIKADSGRLDPDSINKLYVSLINYTNALPPTGQVSAIYDGIRFSIQKKVNEIYDYIFNLIDAKAGFFQKKYGRRNMALGTRNVISPAPLDASSPTANNQLKCDELGIPLFQGAKASIPLVVYHAKTSFFNNIFSPSNDQVALVDPKTFDLVYKPITEDEKNKFISSDGIERIVNLFRDREFRFKPVICKTEDNKYYYLFLVYDDGDTIITTRSIASIKNQLAEKHKYFDPKKLRPMTYAEFLYITTYMATVGKHCTITRYPAQELGSTVPCRIHLLSTNPSRTVNLFIGDSDVPALLPEYPVLGKGFSDSVGLHEDIMGGLNADFDGDTVSVAILLSEEANVECAKYINSPSRWISTTGKGYAGFSYMGPLVPYNLTRDPEEG